MRKPSLGRCVELCRSDNWTERAAGVSGLGNHYDKLYARFWLLWLLNDPNPDVSAIALSILRLCAGEPEVRPVFERIAAGDDPIEALRAQTLLAMYPLHD